MKRFMLISAVLELLAGSMLFFFPHLVPDLAGGPGSHMAMARMFGAAVLGLGIFGFQAWRNAGNEAFVNSFLGAYLVFHIALTIALLASFMAGVFANPAAAILHLVFAAFTGHFLLKNHLAEANRGRKLIYGLGMTIGSLALLLMLLPHILHQAGLHPSYKASKSYELSDKKALVIATSHSVLNAPGEKTGNATGVFASEMTVPYYEFLDAGMQVDVASIKGGEIPIDPQSFYYFLKTPEDRRFQKDEDFLTKVKNSLKIDEIDFTQYDAIWMAGGWGAAYDLGQSEVLGEKISEAYYAEKPIIGSVCHGALGLISAKDT
ncbi:MAG: DJ-1/PfpI family protein, partial [Bacteroidota bacterium]